MTIDIDPRLPESYWRWVEEAESGCLLWTGPTTEDGYGIWAREGTSTTVHRMTYARLVAPIPEGWQVDHGCHIAPCYPDARCPHRRCVRLTHLEAVTPEENMRRARAFRGLLSPPLGLTHCTRGGHEYTPENTKWITKADVVVAKQCRACAREADQRYRRRKRAA